MLPSMNPGYKIQSAGSARVEPLPRRRLVDDAVQALREAILDGRLASGSRLRQVALADELGISRTPLREALGHLQHEGLIELLPSGGVRVIALELQEAVDLYDVREVLDGLAARLAASRANPEALAALKKCLARMKRCVDRGDANHWFAPHVEFHEGILRAASNAPLKRQASLVRLSIQRFHPLLLSTPDRLAQANREHEEILAAIVAHDGEAAERVARAHIASAKEIVLKLMARSANGAVAERA